MYTGGEGGKVCYRGVYRGRGRLGLLERIQENVERWPARGVNRVKETKGLLSGACTRTIISLHLLNDEQK